MKNILITAGLVFMASQLWAQDIYITERAINNKNAQLNTWVIPVGNDLDLVKKTFTEFSKKELKLKPKSTGKMTVVSKEASLPVISSKRGDFEGIIFSEDNTYKMGVVFALGYDIIINSQDNPQEMAALRDITIDYLKFHYTRFYDRSLEKQEKEREKLRKQVKQTEKEISTLRAAIKRNEKRIYKTEDAARELEYQTKIDQNNLKIENLNQQLPELRHQIETRNQEMDQTKHEFNQVMAQIRSLRTATAS